MSSLPSPLKSPPAPPSPLFPAAWASARFPAGICTGAGTTVSAKATPPEGRLPADIRTAVTSNDAASNARLTIAFIVPPSAASTSRVRELRRVDQVVAVEIRVHAHRAHRRRRRKRADDRSRSGGGQRDRRH